MNDKNTESVAASSPLERLVMRVADVELRTCDIHLTSTGEHVTAEIVKWHDGEETCHTIACWRKGKDGFDLSFIGDRPFEACDGDLFWRLAK
ncbi:MAG: hypothetical protein OEL79_11340, partial [Chromatiales bacterium]|nr:hypothetical protein [Chromatiales bacterium]